MNSILRETLKSRCHDLELNLERDHIYIAKPQMIREREHNERSKMKERTENQSAAFLLITTLCADLNFSISEFLSYQDKKFLSKREGS